MTKCENLDLHPGTRPDTNIYEYLRDIERIPEAPDIAQAIASAKDRTAEITDFAVGHQRRSKLCVATIETFASILATEAGNLALKVMSTGGIYVAGGIPLHILSVLEKPGFMEAFKRKGRFAQLMERITVHVILSRAALLGSAAYGLESFKKES